MPKLLEFTTSGRVPKNGMLSRQESMDLTPRCQGAKGRFATEDTEVTEFINMGRENIKPPSSPRSPRERT
jgi:hypothetical protein